MNAPPPDTLTDAPIGSPAAGQAQVDPLPMPRAVPVALAAILLAALIVLRGELTVAAGNPVWFALALLAAGLLGWTVVRWRRTTPLVVVSRAGVAFPHIHDGWLRWRDIGGIDVEQRRHRLGDITDLLVIHLRSPLPIQWRDKHRRRSLGATPQAAVAVELDLSWPMRAEALRTMLGDWTRAVTLDRDDGLTAPPPVRPSRDWRPDALIAAVALALPLVAYSLDLRVPGMTPAGLKLLAAGDTASAIPHLEAEARAGDAASAFALATLYQNGDGIDRNAALAASWFRRAADGGHAEAAYRLGEAYRVGVGVPKSAADAIKWHTTAAGRGNMDAAYVLGRIYRLGEGVRRDYTEATKWLEMAADKGHAPSLHDMGRLYLSGIGVKQDRQLARRTFETAAALRFTPAVHDLAILDLEDGRDGDAVRRLIAAADRGYGPSQLRLAQLLMEGTRTPRDPVEAYKWASLAERALPPDFRPDVEAVRDRVVSTVPPEVLAEAKRRVRSWRPLKP